MYDEILPKKKEMYGMTLQASGSVVLTTEAALAL
jgi:hypothetical protein